jgi:class 3 adenylate cyclase
MQCGQAIRQQTLDDEARHTRLAASVPAPLAEKVRAATLTGERRTVTVLFADVVGSTMLAEKVDVETWTEIMNGAFEHHPDNLPL